MKLDHEMIDEESLISSDAKKILHRALNVIEELNAKFEKSDDDNKCLYIDFNEYIVSYGLVNERTDYPIGFRTFDPERLEEDIQLLVAFDMYS